MYRKILENPENANEYYLKSIMSILLNVIIFLVILIFINTQYKFYIFIYTLLQIIFNFTIEYAKRTYFILCWKHFKNNGASTKKVKD